MQRSRALDDPLLTLADLMRETKLSADRIRRDMWEGRLAFVRFGRALRFEPHEVQRYVSAHRRLVPRNDDGPLAGEPLVRTTAGAGRDAKPNARD